MNKLFIDCKTDEEKYNFFLSGRGYETGVIAASIQNDVAMAYQRCVSFQDELRRLHEVNAELAKPGQAHDHESDAMSVLADVNADLIQDAKPEPVNRSWLSKGNPANAPVRNSGAPPKPEQEPVRWFQQFGDAPPRKEWVGLTDEEIKELLDCGRGGLVDIKKTEQILKEKNT